MTLPRHSNTWKKALSMDIDAIGGQEEAAYLLQVSQTLISKRLNPHKKEKFAEEELFLMWDTLKAQGKIPESVRHLARKYAPLEIIVSMEEDAKQITDNIHKLKNKAQVLQEGMCA